MEGARGEGQGKDVVDVPLLCDLGMNDEVWR